MAANQLQIYNDALVLCKERPLAALTDNVESRRLLDQVWSNDGNLACLEEGQWAFAARTAMIDADPNIQPIFGYRQAFDKPKDWVRTLGIANDEYFRAPLLQYVDEAGYWYCDLQTIYARYVSNDPGYGLNLGLWPRSFTEFVVAHYASKIVPTLTQDKTLIDTICEPRVGVRAKRLEEAKSKAALANPTSFNAPGNWSLARRRGGTRQDGGYPTGNLIG